MSRKAPAGESERVSMGREISADKTEQQKLGKETNHGGDGVCSIKEGRGKDVKERRTLGL